jgi:hypothetical protein
MLTRELFEVIIDNENGAGATPLNDNIDYQGLRVAMRPSVFLRLAAQGDVSKDKFVNYIRNNGAIGAPFLIVNVPENWLDGDFSGYAKVTNHEGRHRMAAILEVEGDNPVETHIVFNNGLRRRHITDEMIKIMSNTLIPQDRVLPITGQLFKPL